MCSYILSFFKKKNLKPIKPGSYILSFFNYLPAPKNIHSLYALFTSPLSCALAVLPPLSNAPGIFSSSPPRHLFLPPNSMVLREVCCATFCSLRYVRNFTRAGRYSAEPLGAQGMLQCLQGYWKSLFKSLNDTAKVRFFCSGQQTHMPGGMLPIWGCVHKSHVLWQYDVL